MIWELVEQVIKALSKDRNDFTVKELVQMYNTLQKNQPHRQLKNKAEWRLTQLSDTRKLALEASGQVSCANYYAPESV